MYNNELFEKIINSTKGKDADACGCYKDCTFYKDESTGNELAILKTSKLHKPLYPSRKQTTTAFLKQIGLKTPKIIYHTQDYINYYEIQEKAKGEVLFKNPVYMINNFMTTDEICEYNKNRLIEILSAPDEHFKNYVKSIFIGSQLGIWNDLHNNNIVYDEKNGFSFIDLPDDLPDVSLEDLKEIINKPLSSSSNNFAKDLFSPFNQSALRDGRLYRNTILNNFVNHKILNGLQLAINEFDPNIINESKLKEIKEALIGPSSPFQVESDLNTKFYLIHFGIIEPSQEEKQFLIDIDNAYSPGPPDDLLSFFYGKSQDSEESISLLKSCVNETTINNIPATEYFTNLDTSIIINNYNQTDDYDSLEI